VAASRDTLQGPAASWALVSALLRLKDATGHCYPTLADAYADPAFLRNLGYDVRRLRTYHAAFGQDLV